MRRVPVDHLKPEMILGTNIFNARGDIMLKRGVTLSQRLIGLLRQRGYLSAYVTGEETRDVDENVGPILSEPTQIRLTQKMQTIFERMQAATRNLHDTPLDALTSYIEKGEMRNAVLQTFHATDLVQEINDIVDELMDVNVISGINSIKTFDTYTFQHSIDVLAVAVVLGKHLGLPIPQLRQLASGCLLHDIGKIFIPKETLNKPGRLTPEEWTQIHRHPEWGYRLLRSLGSWQIIPFHVAYQHHERQDGHGYPRGLKGLNTLKRTAEQERGHILLVAEICSVADVFDAMTSDRPYRLGLSIEEALNIIASGAGTAFNQEIVREFLQIAPPYPVGSHVIIHNGSLNGYQATVVNVRHNPVRPTIRLVRDARGNPVTPSEIDLAGAPEITLSAALL